MATYKTNRSRTASFIGKFKFNYEVLLGQIPGGEFAGTGRMGVVQAFPTNALVVFGTSSGFSFNGIVSKNIAANNFPVTFDRHPWNEYGGLAGFDNLEYDSIAKTVKIPFTYKLDSQGQGAFSKSISGSFILEVVNIDLSKEFKQVTGSVEGVVYYGNPLEEYVEIDEFLPSEIQTQPSSSNCGDDEIVVLKDLDKDTVRQFPRYTTLNWYEMIRPNSSGTMGIEIIATNSKGQVNKFSRFESIKFATARKVTYAASKLMNAWAGNIDNNGYISFYGSTPDAKSKLQANTTRVSVDSNNFSIRHYKDPLNLYTVIPNLTARIDYSGEPIRTVTFEANVYDWKNLHTDPLRAYLVGFGSTYYPKRYKTITYNQAQYLTVDTSSGNISASQTYEKIGSSSVEAREGITGVPSEIKSNSLIYDNSQRWIYGMIDGIQSKDIFDDLDSPTDHMDYPDKYILGADGCENINYLNQELTICEDELPSGSASIPIPIRGWKFNAMTLKQDNEFLVPGTGNTRNFLGDKIEPHYYGDFNLSGYRYLNVELKSKNNDVQNSSLSITEISKGFTLDTNSLSEQTKSWKVKTDTNVFKNIVLDLCNPDNKIDKVDNQDSPYPRLNTYTLSKPISLKSFGVLSVENKPKDEFLIVGPPDGTINTKFIDDALKAKIKNSGIVYLTDPISKNIEYFDVNTSAFPRAGVGTNYIFGFSRIHNGKIKLATPFNTANGYTYDNNGNKKDKIADYFKTIYFYKVQNDLTKEKSMDEILFKNKDGKYLEEFEIYDYNTGYPDITDTLAITTSIFVDGSANILVQHNDIFVSSPYDGVVIEHPVTKVKKEYKIFQYTNSQANGISYFTVQIPVDYNNTILFPAGSYIKLSFFGGKTDDRFQSIVVKFSRVEKVGQNKYAGYIEYTKLDKYSSPNYDGIPEKINGNDAFFNANAPLITVNNPRLVEFTFPKDTVLNTNLLTQITSQNEVNAIDDYPEDETSNGPYYGVSRIGKLQIDNDLLELGKVKLARLNSLSNFVYSGNNNTFEAKTKFIVAQNANTGVPTETTYYTRRFWQQNTDGRDEEEGDITWQNTPIKQGTQDNWTLFPKSISDLCDDINKVDDYVAPRWLDPNNSYSSVIRHPGWTATKFSKTYATDPITGNRIYTTNLDPEYLNPDTGYATWIYGGGLLALPSGKNSGSGTSYIQAIDINFNELQNILAQTIFHRINANFPPGLPDLFGNTSLLNSDGTQQVSVLHLRGGIVARGPGYGLILPPQKSNPDNLRQANLIEAATGITAGSSESDIKGYFETGPVFGKNKVDHYIELEKSKNFPTPSDYRSSTRNFTQAKRERAVFKGGKQNLATNLSACESGFEKSIVIAYTIPTTKPGEESQTGIISTDSFFTQQYEKYPVGFNTKTGTGVTIKGEFPFVLGSETHINQTFRVNTFLFTERNSNTKATSSHDFDCLIAANTDMRNKLSWYPFIDGQAKKDANFSTLSKAFTATKYNSYVISDQSPQLFNVGYADPGAIVFRSISLNTTNIKAPVTDKTIFIDGIAPTYISDFRLIDQFLSSGTAYSSFPTVAQISSREYIVAYALNSNPRKINFKIISNYQLSDKNTLFDLDALTGSTLTDKYNIYGLTSDYDERLGLHRSVFWCNGGIYYFEYALNSGNLGRKRSDKLHLIKGKLDEALVSDLRNRNNIVTYYNSSSELNAEVPIHKPAIITCKKQEYSGNVLVVYDTGKCYLEAVLFHPFSEIVGVRKFDIECANNSGSSTIDTNGQVTTPIANIQANPTSGQSALLVNFLSTNSYDPGGSTLTYVWNFGDETQSTEENPSHTFVNTTTSPIQFKVTLIVTNISGVSSAPATITITVDPAPVNNLSPQAKFSATPISGDVTLTVTFTDQSTAANDGSFIKSYQYDFGDGNSAIKFDNKPFTYDYMIAGSFTPTLFVTDNLARSSSKFFGPKISVNGKVNNPPSPNFTWSQTSYSPTLKVQFTDTSVDVEGPLVAWHWDFGDTQTADVQNPEHIYAASGTYSVILTVTDTGGLQVSGTRQVTVLPPGNNPPIANFNYSQQNRKLVVDFTDTSIDTDGRIVSWSWDFGDTSSDNVQNPSHTYSSAKTYQVALTVTDDGGKSNTITKNVTVNALVNQSPIISSITGNQTSFKPLVAKFTETSSDPDGFITQWDWNFGDTNSFSTTDPALKNPTNTYQNPGTYTVTLTVTDDGLPDGTNKKTATSSISFVVAPPPANQPPVALFTVDSNNVLAPATILFTDASTDADGKIVSWLWEFETGSTLFFNTQTYQKTVSHTFSKSGTYPVKLTVTDDGNLIGTYILDIIVKNNAPVAILTAFPNPVLSQTQVSFFGNNSYDIDGSIVKYAWDFGDTTTLSQGTAFETHTYAKPGTYKSSLTVTDNLGDSSTANLFINVTNRSPVARITYTTLTVKAPGSLTFNGDTSTDIDGTITSYSWSVSGSVVATTPNATINFTTQGTYEVSLTVTDDFGATNTAKVTVNVTPPDNILPIAILKVDKNSGVINDTFIFNVSNSNDPDGSIILYQLDFGDNTSTQFVKPAPVSHVYNAVGSYTAKLTVTDNRSGVSLQTIDSVQVITINNQPPVASFSYSPIGAFTFDPIKFTDNSTDPENALSKWVWDFGDLTNFTTTDPLQKNPTKSYNKGNKNYTVALTVYDNFGLSSTTSQVVAINNRKPFAVISTSSTPTNNVITGIAPFTVIFDSNSYDLDGIIANYEWYINGLVGTPFTTKSFTYTFNSPRFTPYVVTLRVQDDDGFWSDTVNIGVKVNAPNVPPVAVITANPVSNSSFAPVSVTFSAAGSYDPDNVGGPLIYAWDFGNGSISDQVIAVTTYTNSGTYKVSLKVTDNLGATNTATLDYIVKNNKPVALIDTLPSGIASIKINTPIVFTSSGSYDSDANQFINGYKWLKDGVNQNSNTPTFETSFDSVGNHIITLSVFDNLGLESDPVSKTVFVFQDPIPAPNQNPIAILANEPGVTGYLELKVGDSFTFDGTTSYDPEDGSNITYEWSISGVKSGYTSTFTNQFNTIGIFTVNLVVFDTKKLSSTPATNLGKRYSIDVNVSAAPNPLANKLFSSGQALFGAIASGSNTPDRFGFQLVDDTKQYTIIEAGLYHTFAVDADGKLYASGSNSNGQLGFSSNVTQINSLTLVPLANKYKVLKVSAGDYCSAIIAEDTSINKRVLLVCGSNINGIFGQALPKTDIYNFQPILERANNFSGASYTSNNGLIDVSCNSYILAFTDNKQVWVAGSHGYTNKTGIIDTGFFPINIDPNPDLQPGSRNYLNPFRLEVGFNNLSGYVTGLSYDIDNQIVWFAGLSNLRGWGYAYDISTYENTIVVITASLDPFFDHAIYLYFFSYNEIPQFNVSAGLASDLNPGENFLKVSAGKFGYLALSDTLFYPYGLNDYGQLGYSQSISSSIALNTQNSLPSGVVLPNKSVQGIADIAAGGIHSIILASNVKPSTYSFTITKPTGYSTDPQYPIAVPFSQTAG